MKTGCCDGRNAWNGLIVSNMSCFDKKSGLTLSWFIRSSASVFTIDHLSLCRWVLCTNHTEPVKGFLGRFLRRKLIETEIDKNMRSNDLIKIIDWIPKTWQHLNGFLEAHSSSDVTIGQSHTSTHTSTVCLLNTSILSQTFSQWSDRWACWILLPPLLCNKCVATRVSSI